MSATQELKTTRALMALLAVCTTASSAATVEYIHTDALGSIVAVTDVSGAALERREYEPFGEQLAPTVQNGPGYTGHVQDAATGLTHMQQRYYDAVVGRFLSVDPVAVEDNGDLRHLNRYAYAYANPYTFKDPDGRASCADPACNTSTIDPVLPRANIQPPPLNGGEGLTGFEAKRVNAGYVTNVTFENDEAGGASPNQPISTGTAEMVEAAISKSGVHSVNINSTTGGEHDADSNHYRARAVDINRVDGHRVDSSNVGAARIQAAARGTGQVRENFGPTIMEKAWIPGGASGPVTNQSLIQAHQDHVHLSGQR